MREGKRTEKERPLFLHLQKQGGVLTVSAPAKPRCEPAQKKNAREPFSRRTTRMVT